MSARRRAVSRRLCGREIYCHEAVMDSECHTGTEGIMGEWAVVYRKGVIGFEAVRPLFWMPPASAKGATESVGGVQRKQKRRGIAEGPAHATNANVAANGARRAMLLVSMMSTVT